MLPRSSSISMSRFGWLSHQAYHHLTHSSGSPSGPGPFGRRSDGAGVVSGSAFARSRLPSTSTARLASGGSPLAGRQRAGGVLLDEVPQGDQDLEQEDRPEQPGEPPPPLDPRQRAEEYRVGEVAGRVQAQLPPRGRPARQPLLPLVVPEGVEGAERTLGQQQGESEFHRGTTSPSYPRTGPSPGRARRTVTTHPRSSGT